MGLNETFTAIRGYEGYYAVSRNGVVKSLTRTVVRKGRGGLYHTITKLGQTITPKKRGPYLAVQLYKDGVKKFYSIHRLVAEVFIPNPYKHTQINHKDENKHNNCVSNLEWCSPCYNQTYSQGKELKLISPDGVVVMVESIRQFCRQYGLNKCGIWRLHNGKQKQTKGWRLPSSH